MISVRWVKSAFNDLAAAWLAARDRNAVTAAAEKIEQRLRDKPEEQGESREDNLRILLEVPLGVIFRVLPHENLVLVLSVWRFETHGNDS